MEFYALERLLQSSGWDQVTTGRANWCRIRAGISTRGLQIICNLHVNDVKRWSTSLSSAFGVFKSIIEWIGVF